MSIDKKKPDTSPADGVNTAADEAPDLDAVMRKYDRESATRLWEGTPQLIIRILMAAFGLFCIGMTLFSKAMPEIRLTMFVGCIIIIGFLTYPASKHHVRVNYLPWYDIVLMVVGAACFFYFALNAMTLVRLSTRIETVHVIIGVVGILILMELCRRCVGLPILCVAGVLIVYAFINQLSYAGAVNGATLYDALKPSSTSCSTPPPASSARPSTCAIPTSFCSSSSARSWSAPALPTSSSALPTVWRAGPAAARRRWLLSAPPCAAWCPAPPWATPSPPVPSPSP